MNALAIMSPPHFDEPFEDRARRLAQDGVPPVDYAAAIRAVMEQLDQRASPKETWLHDAMRPGNLIAIIAMLVTILGASFGMWNAYKDDQGKLHELITSVQTTANDQIRTTVALISKVQGAVDATQQAQQQANASTELRTQRYIPLIEALDKSQQLQDQRIQVLTGTVQDLARIVAELTKTVGAIHEDMAVQRAETTHHPGARE